jgi:hypothetical protein
MPASRSNKLGMKAARYRAVEVDPRRLSRRAVHVCLLEETLDGGFFLSRTGHRVTPLALAATVSNPAALLVFGASVGGPRASTLLSRVLRQGYHLSSHFASRTPHCHLSGTANACPLCPPNEAVQRLKHTDAHTPHSQASAASFNTTHRGRDFALSTLRL